MIQKRETCRIFSPERQGLVIVACTSSITDVLGLEEWLETKHNLPGLKLLSQERVTELQKSRAIPVVCFPVVAISNDRTKALSLDSRGTVLSERDPKALMHSNQIYIPLERS
jgi:hypothetical protein